MKVWWIVPLLAVSAAPGRAEEIARQDWQDTIYIVRGESSDLARFHQQFGQQWTGGKAIDADPSDGEISYWAFPERSAAQSRALMMLAIFSGLQLDVQDYKESELFSAERKQLDALLHECAVGTDVLFVTPVKTLEFRPTSQMTGSEVACLSEGARQRTKLTIEPPREIAQD